MTTDPTTTDPTRTRIEADPTLPIVRMTRDFAGTVRQLMRAHTDPEIFQQWIGPDSRSLTVDQWDARTGGSYRYVDRTDPGQELSFRGCFHEITDSRIVQTWCWEQLEGAVSLETVWFEDLGDGRTRLHAQSLVDSFEARDAMLASGMEVGVDEGYAKLDRLLADSAL